MATSLLRYSEAAERIQIYIRDWTAGSGVSPVKTAERLPLASATGRVLAEAIYADRDQPPFPRSTRDGFACRASDANTHQLLFLAGQVRAGQSAAGSLKPGEVWEIMTGAAVPDGADAVFMVEHAKLHSENEAQFVRLVEPRTLTTGENIVPRGAEARLGDLLIPPGVRVGTAQIALAAQCGYDQLNVTRRPRVAILSTGDELVSITEQPGPSQIRNSNAPMLAALVTAAGGEPAVLPPVPDEVEPLDAAIQTALQSDLLLITGGISAGRFDLVEEALTRAGAGLIFRGVAIQPGKPVAFGELYRSGKHRLPFLALPGNPISSAVTFLLFGAPLLAALAAEISPLPRFAIASLAEDWQGKLGLTRFLPAHCDFAIGAPTVRILPWQGSGDIATYARSNCFVAIPDDADQIPAGSPVKILPT
jgi:molybdopterin molybdotransferase